MYPALDDDDYYEIRHVESDGFTRFETIIIPDVRWRTPCIYNIYIHIRDVENSKNKNKFGPSLS